MMPKHSNLSAEELRSVVYYDRTTGAFTWIKSNNQKRGLPQAGNLTPNNYMRIRVCKRSYMAHRLAWLYVYGEWPKDRVDHIDGNRSNNRIENLREATDWQNAANKKVKSDNRLGIKGVELHECGKFRARIFIDGKHKHLGLFETAEMAADAYIHAAHELFGDFARAK